MSHHERVTFTQGREVLDHSIDYLTRIRDTLEALGREDHDERVAMLLDSVQVEQRNLLGAIERLRDDASTKVLDTYAQYTVELPGDIGTPETPLTTLGLIRWLEGCNEPLQRMFADLSAKGESEEVGEVFAGIARQIESLDRQLSTEYQSTEDL